MDFRPLGRTGIKVSPLCLGAMMLGAWGNTDHDESVAIIRRALDSGINFVDTADVYSAGESEVIVGKALAQVDRSSVVLATKVHGSMGKDPNMSGNSRRWILSECESSLRRLGTDWIDLYQIHRPDPTVDIEETLGALTELQAAGKIRAFGCSTFPAHQVVESQWVAERRGLGRFVTEQPPYSLLARGIETDLLPVCAQYGMGVIPWSPLAGGWLSGSFGTGKSNTSRRSERIKDRYDTDNPANARKLEAVDAISAVADEAGITLIELAIAWVLVHPAVTAPIIGPRTMDHLEGQLGAADVHLDTDILDRLDEIVPPGSTLNPADAGWQPPSLTDLAQRRRR